ADPRLVIGSEQAVGASNAQIDLDIGTDPLAQSFLGCDPAPDIARRNVDLDRTNDLLHLRSSDTLLSSNVLPYGNMSVMSIGTKGSPRTRSPCPSWWRCSSAIRSRCPQRDRGRPNRICSGRVVTLNREAPFPSAFVAHRDGQAIPVRQRKERERPHPMFDA